MPNDVLEYFRDTQPDLKNEPDDIVAKYIGEVHPEFLAKDPQFAEYYKSVSGTTTGTNQPLLAMPSETAFNPPQTSEQRGSQEYQAQVKLGLNPHQGMEFNPDQPLASLALPNLPPSFSREHPIATGMAEAMIPAVNSLTTPRNLAYLAGSMGVGATGTIGKALVGSIWTAFMGANAVKEAPRIARELGEQMGLPEDQRDTQKIARLLTEAGIDTAMAVAPAVGASLELHEITGAAPKIAEAKIDATIAPTAPDTAEALKKTLSDFQEQAKQELPVEAITTPEIPNAIRQQEPSQEVLRNAQPEVGLPQVGARNAEPEIPAAAQAGNENIAQQSPVPENAPVSGEGITEMGAASAASFTPEKPFITGIKNAAVDREREARGLPPVMEPARRSFGTVWDEAMKIADEHPEAQDALIDELRDKPRAITDTEDALLLQKQIATQNAYEKSAALVNEHVKNGALDLAEQERIALSKLSDDLLDLYNINKTVGTETGRGLNARKMLADEQYQLSKMVTAKRAMNEGAELTPEQESEIKSQHEKIIETQKALDEAQANPKESQGRLDEAIKETVKRTKKVPTTPEELDAAQEKTIQSIKETLGQTEHTFPDLGSDIQKLMEIFVRRGITDRDELTTAVHDVIKEILPPDWTRRDTMDAMSGYGKFTPLSKDPIKSKIRDIKGQLQQVSKLEDLLARKPLQKTGPERKVPSDKERRLTKLVNEYKRRYGVTVTDPAKQLKSALDAIKTRLTHDIADLESQIASRTKIIKNKTGVQYDAEALKLKERRDALKEQFDEIFGKPELTDEQRIKTAMAATEKSIAEYSRRIAEGDYGPRPKTPSKVPANYILDAMKERRDALKAEYEYLKDYSEAPGKKNPEELALSALKTRLKNSAADYSERLAKGDFAPRSKRITVLDKEAETLKAENERAKQAFQLGLLKDQLKKRPWFQKAASLLQWARREFVLSGVTSLAKLPAAAGEALLFEPAKEAIGYGISKALPGFRSRLQTEAPSSVRIEAKSLAEIARRTMKDSAQIAKTGQTDLDTLFGGRNAIPKELVSYFGRLHQILKNPLKISAWTRVYSKLVEQTIRAGIDPTEPAVVMRNGTLAMKEANRMLFLEDNALVSAYQRGLSAFEQVDKTTGKPNPLKVAVAAGARLTLPIVRIPTNIIARTVQAAVGFPVGAGKLAIAYAKGIKELPPEQADLIMRQLKQGSIGAAFMLFGYFNADKFGGYYQPGEKRKGGDVKPSEMRTPFGDLPTWLLHHPLLQVAQLGATVRRVSDSKLRKKDSQAQGLAAGVEAGLLGLVEEAPFSREILDLAKLRNPSERQGIKGEYLKSLVVPQGVQWAARQMDKNAQGEVIKRKPRTMAEHIKTGIPGLREEVPASK